MIIDKDILLMREAMKEAQKAMDDAEIPIGAVIAHEGKIIARAHNQVERLKDVTAHAEMLAITSAAHFIGGKYLDECELFVTLEPCMMCVGAIRHARFKRVVFGAIDNRHILKNRWETLLQNTEVKGGVLDTECEKILHDFFETKRKS